MARTPHVTAVADDLRFRFLGLLEARADLSQRQIAQELGIALGRVNGLLHALIDAGLVAVEVGQDAAGRNRPTYAPTARGQAERARLTPVILAAKQAELARLTAEIAALSSLPPP